MNLLPDFVTMPQPKPKPGLIIVSDAFFGIVVTGSMDIFNKVAVDVAKRGTASEAKYGSRLMTHNGRIADVDDYQEMLDSIAYKAQGILEETDREALRDRRIELKQQLDLALSCRNRLVKRGLLKDE